MQTLLVDLAVSMTEFKKNPAAVLRQAAGRPVAVLNHNKVDFYLLGPALMEALLAQVGPLPGGDEPGAASPPAAARRQALAPFLAPAPAGKR